MGAACCEVYSLETPLGKVLFEGPVDSSKLESLHINNKLNNFRPPDRQKEALVAISKMPEGMVYIARNGSEIIGYVTFHQPDKFSRWSKHPRVIELGAIEISPDWRKCGIGETLLKEAFNNSFFEHFIVVTIEFCWHWDLQGCGLVVFDYQKMLAKLFGTAGLKRRFTDDPDVMEHPANVLLARVGKKVKKDDVMMFENMLFEGKQGTL